VAEFRNLLLFFIETSLRFTRVKLGVSRSFRPQMQTVTNVVCRLFLDLHKHQFGEPFRWWSDVIFAKYFLIFFLVSRSSSLFSRFSNFSTPLRYLPESLPGPPRFLCHSKKQRPADRYSMSFFHILPPSEYTNSFCYIVFDAVCGVALSRPLLLLEASTHYLQPYDVSSSKNFSSRFCKRCIYSVAF